MTASEQDRLGLGLVRQPRTVIFGPGQRNQLGYLAAGLARSVLVVTDSRMAESDDFVAMMDDLKARGLAVTLYARAAPDLPRSTIIEAVSAALAFAAAEWLFSRRL